MEGLYAGRSDAYSRIAASAASIGADLDAVELARIAEDADFGESELAAVGRVFDHLAAKHRETAIRTLLKLSRLPQKAPKTFENFDFSRIKGRDCAPLRKLPALSNLHARKNLAFIGPGGIGKTHLAQAYGHECCMQGYKTYYIKANELRDRLAKSVENGTSARVVKGLVKPSCLIVDEVGRCRFDLECTNLFFDVIDRRYEKEGPNTLILTSNTPVVNWDQFFTGDDTLLCALDRVFDRASVFIMKGASFRGAECETFSVEALPTTLKSSR